jgi:hypothetical protein
MANNYIDGQQIFFGTCLGSDDPLMLGRVRVLPETMNEASLANSNSKFDENSTDPNKNGPWSDVDPFVYLPLLPYFVNQVPKKGEKVMLFYYNTNTKTGRNKFYMISTFSSPTTIKFEDASSSQTRLNSGYGNSSKKLPPIKNQNGTYKNEKNKGVFPEPVDISLNGRDSADLILKESEVLLRAGKHKNFSTGQIPEADSKRAFLQLSKYDTDITFGNAESKTKLVQNKTPIKYLVEYDVLNPENQFSAFTGVLYIYQLRTERQAEKTLTGNFNVTTNIDLTGTTDGVQLIRMINFPIGLSLDELSTQINQRLRSIITDPSTTLLSPTVQKNQQYPFYYRPSKKIFNLITNPVSGQFISSANMAKLTSMVKISSADKIPGYGLVLDSKLSPNIPFEKQSSAYAPSTSKLSENTVALLGGTKLYLLSNETSIEGKSQINFNKGIYGFEQNDLIDDIEPNTSSMVRGEELLELLQLIVKFCITHVHPYPGLPPTPTTVDGTTVDDLLSNMLNAYQKVLNSNIRLN